MFRKIALSLAAATVVATAAIPTSASAWENWRHRHRSGVSVTIGAPYYSYGYGPRYSYAYGPRCYVTKRWVHTHWGWKRKLIRRCY